MSTSSRGSAAPPSGTGAGLRRLARGARRHRRAAGHGRRLVRRPVHHPGLGVAGRARPAGRTVAGRAGRRREIVSVAPDGATVADPADTAAVEEVVAGTGQAPQVAGVVGPFESQAISPGRTRGAGHGGVRRAREELDESSVDALAGDDGGRGGYRLEVAVGGDAFGRTGARSARPRSSA